MILYDAIRCSHTETSPVEFCARIILDGAKTELDLNDYDLAITCFNEVIEKYPGTFAVPEAIFYVSVAKHLAHDQANNLRQGLEKLRKEFPENEWTQKAKPYEAIGL